MVAVIVFAALILVIVLSWEESTDNASVTAVQVPDPTLGPPEATVVPPPTSVTTLNQEPTTAPVTAALSEVTLLSVTDGDTIRVQLPDGTDEPLRLIGINSPERGECYSAESTAALTALLGSGPLTLVSDTSDRDQFDRLLRYVFVGDLFASGDLFVNEELVRSGHALARRYEPDTSMATVLEEAQQEAIDAGRGLWNSSACGPVSTASIEIVALAYNPPGSNDNENLNEEWVALGNTGGSDLDLDGWVVKDESASHRFAFPTNFVLSAGQHVVIHTGCGDNGQEHLYWCETRSAVWNNSGDTVFVLDPAGNIVTFLAYDESRRSDGTADLTVGG